MGGRGRATITESGGLMLVISWCTDVIGIFDLGERLRDGICTRGIVPDQTASDRVRSSPHASETAPDTLRLAHDERALVRLPGWVDDASEVVAVRRSA
jgi:hypothetical protein